MDRLTDLGRRIRWARTRAHRTQAAIAGLCGIQTDYLSQIERGLRTPSLEVLVALARELGVPLSQLLGEEREPRQSSPPPISTEVVAALLEGAGAGTAHDPRRLRARVDAAWENWQTAADRYTRMSGVLPGLVRDVEATLRALRAPGDTSARREVLCCAVDTYNLLRSYCRRAGRGDLSLMVGDRALRAAEEAEDSGRIAAAHWNLSHILLGSGPLTVLDVELTNIGLRTHFGVMRTQGLVSRALAEITLRTHLGVMRTHGAGPSRVDKPADVVNPLWGDEDPAARRTPRSASWRCEPTLG